MAFALEEGLEEFAHLRIIVDDQNRSYAASISNLSTINRVPQILPLRCCLAWWEHYLDGEDGALSWLRADPNPMAKQIAQALHDGQTEAKATAPLTRGVVKLMVLLEDRLKFVIWDADPGVANLNAQYSPAPTTTKQHLAASGVF
jgi:hypothetical protein